LYFDTILFHIFITGYWDEKARNILIEVFSTSSQVQVGALFREINAAEPVRLVDLLMQEEAPLPIESNSSSDSDTSATRDENNKINSKLSTEESATTARTLNSTTGNQPSFTSTGADASSKSAAAANIIGKGGEGAEDELDTASNETVLSQEALVAVLDETVDGLAAAYPDMFKPSSRCKPPHLNVDVLRDDLFQSEFLSRHDVRSAEDLRSLLDRVNRALGEHHQHEHEHEQNGAAGGLSKSAAAALKKATEHGFYLGLDKAWMYLSHPLPPADKADKA